ncbi:type IV pilin protein [Glaciimonas sp. PAMC28666]|uniref:type IV pilin protein n=1 Tax=Glaciimonas sp. PAMC28666 TaxID=2807626 RepID=UPI0019624630|nr:type IV pilin protein [Glaciimonas sp. PAMC28666]QRX81266.1 prepilin-type N-terminal cleavage/methylation domain-containing protein [Glaciimonas sp. PAMC28666]
MRRKINPGHAGFTLVEVMVVVAIVGILASIALPNYSEYIRRTERTEAITRLLQAANWLEQQYTVNNSYLINGGTIALPADLNQSPATGTAKYRLNIVQANDTSFILEAETVDEDRCGTYTLDQTGFRDVSGGDEDSTAELCWAGG